ncbi:MAG: hypothetical protein NTY02_07950 [Acidobacteria bacterium]|nr:hypothetical protein [Acidobacteriota bacterium]
MSIIAVAALVAAGPAGAQDGPAGATGPKPAATAASSTAARKVFLGVGGSYIASRTDCTNCDEEGVYWDGWAVHVDGGLTVNDRLDVGAEIFSTHTTTAGVGMRSNYALAVAQYRPWASRGFFLKGGIGMVFFRGDTYVEGHGTADVKTRGMGVHYGVGWLIRRERRVAFAPFAGHYVATLGDVQGSDWLAENVVSNNWVAGLTVIIR